MCSPADNVSKNGQKKYSNGQKVVVLTTNLTDTYKTLYYLYFILTKFLFR